LLVSDSITVGDNGILATTASIGTLFDTPATINFGTAASDDSLYNIATGSTASGATKTVNIGTNGLPGSTTNIKIGSTNSGTTTLQNYTVVDDILKVNDDLIVGTVFSVDVPTGNTFIGGTAYIKGDGSTNTPALRVGGKLLVGDQIFNTALSNALDLSIASGLKAFRTINIVDTAGQFKILRVNSSTGASVDLQQWNETLTSNITFWDVIADSGRLVVRDRIQGTRNRLVIDESGRFLIGSTTSTTIAAAASEIDPNFMLAVKGNVNVAQTLWVGDGRISTTAVSASVFNDVSSLTVGSSSLTTAYNLAIGNTGSGSTKTVNIATNGGPNSITNVNIGSSESGTTRLLNATSVDKTLSVAGNLAVGSKFAVDTPSGNTTVDSLLVTSGSITSTATSAVLFASPQSISFGASTQNSLDECCSRSNSFGCDENCQHRHQWGFRFYNASEYRSFWIDQSPKRSVCLWCS
jgi:hypothetical protein